MKKTLINLEKQQVHDFWNKASCGEELYLKERDRAGYVAEMETRYSLEPYILDFARFDETRGLRVLEIGVGLGADHQRFAAAGADLWGIDLTERAVEHTRARLACFGLRSRLVVGDAEALDFDDESFDYVYSWGVLHHSPDTPKAVAEVRRVLKRGGATRIMVYHKWSMIGLMLWLRYALLGLRPWLTLSQIYGSYLESRGTKAYSVGEAHDLFGAFRDVRIRTVLTHGDLLESDAGQRHRGLLLEVAKRIWPRRLLQRLFPGAGLFMLIEAIK